MNKLLLYIFGSIYFKAQGGFPERFLNLCNVKGIKLHALRCESGTLFAETTLASFRKIRRCASRSGMKVKILEKRGLPFLYARFAHRSGLFLGLALAAFLLFFYSRSIWSIEVDGNEHIPDAQVIEALYRSGIYEGVFKNSIDYHKLSFSLYEALPEVSWLNVGIDGSRLTVNLREAVPKPESRNSGGFCNIVASCGGVIDSMRVQEGEALVQEGDGVSEGELLVSGVVFHEQAKRNTFHRAAAQVLAYTKRKTDFEIKKSRVKTRYTGRKKRLRVLRVFRLKVPLYLFAPLYREREVSVLEKPLRVSGKQLPIALYEYEIKEIVRSKSTLTKQDASALARSKKAHFEKQLKAGTKIIRCKERIHETKNAFHFEYEYELYEDIACVSEIQIDDKNVNNSMEKPEK